MILNKNDHNKKLTYCSENEYEIKSTMQRFITKGKSLKRTSLLKIIVTALLSIFAGSNVYAETPEDIHTKIVNGKRDDIMIIDKANCELRISATVTKDVRKPSIADWGCRGQAFFGVWGGKMERFFIFTTGVSRPEVDKALQQIGLHSHRQIPMNEVKKRSGLKASTTAADYLDGDPVICTIRYKKEGKLIEGALENFIMEKIVVDGSDVIKPYTPHFIYHGTGEAVNFPSGCIICPSGCNGGIITDNALPLSTTLNQYKVNWDVMPPVGSRVEVVLKSIYGPQPMTTIDK